MSTHAIEEFAAKKCRPCEGGVPKLSHEQAVESLRSLAGWRISHDGLQLEKEWLVKSFKAGMDFLDRVAVIADEEGHHPEIHLTGFRHVCIEIWTHAVGGLTENDFILAAKIDLLPIELKQ
jgi:4a-hydroxytetrahydrobiopterin dehydratase